LSALLRLALAWLVARTAELVARLADPPRSTGATTHNVVQVKRPRRTRNSGRLVVEPTSDPYWVVRGWKRRGNKLTGAYRTPRRSVAGEIELDSGGRPTFFVINSPQPVLSGSHGACFRPREDGRYWVHFSTAATRDIDGGILAIEEIVGRALRGR